MNERDADMLESIKMWMREIEPQWVEKEMKWLDELEERLNQNNHEGLDEAAEKLYPDVWFPHPADGLVQSRQKERNAFKAGAEWQKAQDDKYVDTIYQQGIEKGKDEMKEQMMKEAEETDLYWDGWDGDFLAIDLNMAALGYSERDKVRVIVIPNTDEK